MAKLENGLQTQLFIESKVSTLITHTPSSTSASHDLVAEENDLNLIENPLIYFFGEGMENTKPTITSIAGSKPSRKPLGVNKLEITTSKSEPSTVESRKPIKNPPSHAKPEVPTAAETVKENTVVESSKPNENPPVNAKPEVSTPTVTIPLDAGVESSLSIKNPPVHAKPGVPTSEETVQKEPGVESSNPIKNLPVHAKPEVPTSEETAQKEPGVESSNPIKNLPVHAKPEVSQAEVTPASNTLAEIVNTLPPLTAEAVAPSSVPVESMSITISGGIVSNPENTGFQSVTDGNSQSPNYSQDQSLPTDVPDTSRDSSSEDAQSSSENSNMISLIIGASLGVIIMLIAALFIGYRFQKSNLDNDVDRDTVEKNSEVPEINKGMYQHPLGSKSSNSFQTNSSFVGVHTMSYLGLEEVHIISPSSPISVLGSLDNSHLFRRQKDLDGMNMSETNSGVYSYVSSAQSGESLNPFKGKQFTSFYMDGL